MTEEDQKGAGEYVEPLEPLEHLQRCSQRGSLRGNNIIISRKALKALKKPTPGTLPHRSDGIGQTETGPHTRAATEKWLGHPNLQRRPHAPHAGRGRLQRQIRRAFMAGGNELTSSQVYDWAYSRHRSHLSEAVRWSVHRILLEIADRVRRVPPHGAWLWRLKQEATSGHRH